MASNVLFESTSRSPSETTGAPIVPRPPSSLRTNPRNARVHSKKQIRQIANSIKAAGFDGADMVLAGHGRLKAAELLGMDLVTDAYLSRAKRGAETRVRPGRQ